MKKQCKRNYFVKVVGTLSWHAIFILFLIEISISLSCSSPDVLWHTPQKIQHHCHCLPAHAIQKLLHADTVTAFPKSLKPLSMPLCLSALLPLYSQITAIAPIQSLYYRIKEPLENKLYSFPCVLHSAPSRTLLPTWSPRTKLLQTWTPVSAQSIISVVNKDRNRNQSLKQMTNYIPDGLPTTLHSSLVQ